MRQAPHLDGGAGREIVAAEFHPRVDMLEISVDVGGEGLAFTTSAQVAPAAASAVVMLENTWRICARMSPLPTISALLLRDRMPDRNTSLPGTTVTTGAYSTWPLTTRLDRPSGKMFCRSTIVWLLSGVVRTPSYATAR